MKADVKMVLGTQIIGPVVFGAAGYILSPSIGTSVGLVLGWFASIGVVNGVFNPGEKPRVFEQRTAKQPTTLLLPNDSTGFTSRITSEIDFIQWQTIGQIIIAQNSHNMNGSIIKRAFPTMNQEDRRDLRNEIVGLLSPEHVGVLVIKGNAAEITRPGGYNFFKRLSRGMVSPLVGVGIPVKLPHTPHHEDVLLNSVFTQHTRATHGIQATLSG